MAYLDVLVPAAPDPRDLLERLRALSIRDGGKHVDLGPLDQATLNLARLVLGIEEKHLWLELPRGKHDFAVMLGLYLQLLRRGERMLGRIGELGFDGPVIVVGLNSNLTERLRRIKIGAESLSEALRAQRVRADGQVTDLRGTISPAKAWHDGLLYLNTSLGWPSLPGVTAGAVIVDRTSFRNPATLERALAWAKAHGATRTVVLRDLGDPAPTKTGEEGWVRWSWTPSLRADVAYELGIVNPCGPLSTNALLAVSPPPVGTAIYRAPALARTRRRCLAGIGAARRLHLEFPKPVADCIQLVNQLSGLWGSVPTANEWAVADPRGVSIATLARSVQSARGEELRGPWRGFAETQWPDLRRHALELTERLTEYNPRLDILLGVLDWAAIHRPGHRITVRTHSRSGALALRQDLQEQHPSLESLLSDTDPQTAQLLIAPYSERLPWACHPSLEVHLGVPAPWRRSALVSGESGEHLVVLDQEEHPWLMKVLTGLEAEWTALLQSADARLDLDGVPDITWSNTPVLLGPLDIDRRGIEVAEESYATPSLDLAQLFASFAEALTSVEHPEFNTDRGVPVNAGTPSVLARPILLEPGDTLYWLPLDARAEVLVGNRCTTVAVADLTAGMALLVPRGETRADLYQRLLQAMNKDTDVMAVEMLLARFRAAVRDLHHQCGSWDDAARALRSLGSHVTSGQTCRLWAIGEVIAPDDVEDIRRVGWLTHNQALTAEGAWRRLGAVAGELRRLHRQLGRLLSAAMAEAVSGQRGAALENLSELCGGVDTAEILEEFEIRRVQFVGPPSTTGRDHLRRLLPAPTNQSFTVR